MVEWNAGDEEVEIMFKSLLKKILKGQRIHKFQEVNEHPTLKSNCIYAANHSCKWDGQYLMELIPGEFSFLAGKQRMKFIDRFGLTWNGIIWVDRKDKKSKALSKQKMKKVINKGKSLCIFPEGTWNLEPSLPVLPLYWGVIEMAQTTHVPIVPVCLEYVDDICYVKYGEVISVDKDADKAERIQYLREVLATLKWDIWEMLPTCKRCNVEEDYWDREVQRRLKEYELLDYEYEMSCVRKG
ncbi:MAG: 1-acyl-sn-glycerol-3-phosphate acyltransferase [Lachnospiraceae bacterium]|nr:1-acyl-sn-glycerol-3-phosphate acyltransferase [Lachnospiraceae bacterium]